MLLLLNKVEDTMTIKSMPNGYLIECKKGISIENTRYLSQLADYLKNQIPEIRSVVVGYESLGVYLEREDCISLRSRLELCLEFWVGTNIDISENWNTHRIPVCYDYSICPDLKDFCIQKNISLDRCIELHANTTYFVAMIGFLPGFVYLGGLIPELAMPRKSFADPSIKKGSVAIGGMQTGIYPTESPGGWNVIGMTPIAIFDVKKTPPSPFKTGDLVIFEPITIREYVKWRK